MTHILVDCVVHKLKINSYRQKVEDEGSYIRNTPIPKSNEIWFMVNDPDGSCLKYVFINNSFI